MLAVCDILAIAQHADRLTLGDGHMQIDEPGVLAVAVVEEDLPICLGDAFIYCLSTPEPFGVYSIFTDAPQYSINLPTAFFAAVEE